jgi:hypothetical protein
MWYVGIYLINEESDTYKYSDTFEIVDTKSIFLL